MACAVLMYAATLCVCVFGAIYIAHVGHYFNDDTQYHNYVTHKILCTRPLCLPGERALILWLNNSERRPVALAANDYKLTSLCVCVCALDVGAW